MNRRRFIQRSFILSGAPALSFKSSFLYARNRSGEVSGKVASNGAGLNEVLVSDSFSIVKTDKRQD